MAQQLIKVPPTKNTLLSLKKQVRFLEEGHDLLERLDRRVEAGRRGFVGLALLALHRGERRAEKILRKEIDAAANQEIVESVANQI